LKLQPDRATGVNVINACLDDHLIVNGQVWRQPLLLSAQGDPVMWDVGRFDELASEHFERIARLAPELVILGSGKRLRFAHPSITQPLMAQRIGIETMSTAAACRTFNVLANEGRRVLAAMLISE